MAGTNELCGLNVITEICKKEHVRNNAEILKQLLEQFCLLPTFTLVQEDDIIDLGYGDYDITSIEDPREGYIAFTEDLRFFAFNGLVWEEVFGGLDGFVSQVVDNGDGTYDFHIFGGGVVTIDISSFAHLNNNGVIPFTEFPNYSDDFVDLIVIYGQSNAMGRGLNSDLSIEAVSEQDRIYIWSGTDFEKLNISANNNKTFIGDHGIEGGFAELIDYSRKDIYLVKVASGGINAQSLRVGANYFDDMFNLELLPAINNLISSGVKVNLTWYYMQGEQDANDQTFGDFEYLVDFIIETCKESFPTSKFILGQVAEVDSINATEEEKIKINEIISKLATKNRCYTLSNNRYPGLVGDPAHFNSSSQVEMGRELLSIIKDDYRSTGRSIEGTFASKLDFQKLDIGAKDYRIEDVRGAHYITEFNSDKWLQMSNILTSNFYRVQQNYDREASICRFKNVPFYCADLVVSFDFVMLSNNASGAMILRFVPEDDQVGGTEVRINQNNVVLLAMISDGTNDVLVNNVNITSINTVHSCTISISGGQIDMEIDSINVLSHNQISALRKNGSLAFRSGLADTFPAEDFIINDIEINTNLKQLYITP